MRHSTQSRAASARGGQQYDLHVRDRSFERAFAFSAAALLFLIAGSIGYTLSREVASRVGHWTDGPILWELIVGLVCAGVAAFYWRRTLVSASSTSKVTRQQSLRKR